MIWQLAMGVGWALSWLFTMSYLVRAWARLFDSQWLARASELANDLWNEIKYLYLAENVIGPFLDNAADGRAAGPVDYIASLLGAGLWWWMGRVFDDDDRWKKRKAKLTEKVSQVGGRLVVVPARG